KVTWLLPRSDWQSLSPESGATNATRFLMESASSRARYAANEDLRFWSANGISDVANRVDQRGFAQLFSQSTNEHFNQLGVVFVCVFPDALAQLRAREDAAWFAHQHL